uniref:Myb-like domain-containing protein n=1 Tax=Pectinophora gossypiella TaxID=13191 RepID=A0A1E1WCN3_PECGO
MEKYTMVKTEVQPNGEILLFYVDENATTEDGSVVTTIDQSQLQQLQENYILEEVPTEDHIENIETTEVEIPDDPGVTKDRWLHEETKRLLIFYIDNRESFQNSAATKKHLWSVACKTILNGKNVTSCEMKLRHMKKKYSHLRLDATRNKVDPKTWPYYELCHQAFHDDTYVKMMLTENSVADERQATNIPASKLDDGTVVIKKMNKVPDEKVKHMLELYLQHKKESGKDYLWQKHVWDKIALELGEDGDYWHKRYLNYKQHYIRMLEKQQESGFQNITWPYMKLFEQIYAGDEEFTQKYGQSVEANVDTDPNDMNFVEFEWDETEKTVLIKYYFDCFDEFQDRTIPNSFLWNEIGRLLDKTPESCKEKYEELKTSHINLYLEGGYNLRSRKPIAILFDNIISKEVQIKLQPSAPNPNLNWPTEKTDEFVQFLFDNMEMFKDPICYYVCWAVAALKLEENVQNCKDQWSDLTTLYKSILNDKKEDPDLQIYWRYIDIFDRIFDYGMDTNFLEGYDQPAQEDKKNAPNKKVTVKKEEDISDDDDFEEKTSGKRSRGTSDPVLTKILEYYLKNKDKFATTPRKKQALWEVLAKQVGISAEQCAHRFRNLKQVYTMHIQREINKPERPILWPYYALCKKVFGYRAIKNKLKNGKVGSDDGEEWSTKEIKTLINHIANHLDIDSDPTDNTKWSSLAQDIGKTETSCREKFLELRKSYRKIKTMISKNPDCKVNWKYFKMFDEIYSKERIGMEVGSSDENVLVPMELPTSENKVDIQDDDFQCIIVIQEGEDISDLSNAQIIIKDAHSETKPEENTSRNVVKWTAEDKMELLKFYYNYVKKNDQNFINIKDMWNEIASHFPNRPKFACRRMYITLKSRYKKLKETGQEDKIMKSKHYRLLKDIMSLKLKFYRPPPNPEEVSLKEMTTYTDVPMPPWKIENALKYYLNHVEEFVNPKYDKKYAWIELSKSVSVPLVKIFKKINYLKQFYNSETNEVNGEKIEFGDILREILEKEFICKIAMGTVPEPMNTDSEEQEITWSDDEVESLLLWYLENLDKFKNPKYAPSYLWLEASNVLHKTPLACSKKMMDIRSQYSAMVKDNLEGLNNWRFYVLCQKIYGTGKKNSENSE